MRITSCSTLHTHTHTRMNNNPFAQTFTNVSTPILSKHQAHKKTKKKKVKSEVQYQVLALRKPGLIENRQIKSQNNDTLIRTPLKASIYHLLLPLTQ